MAQPSAIARTSGFTIVELMVVVAIIMLLIAILLPSMSRAREAARRAVCSSNQHVQTSALLLYTSDNWTHFPVGYRDNGAYHSSWIHSATYDYLRHSTGFKEPSFSCPNMPHWFGIITQYLIDELPDTHPEKARWQDIRNIVGVDIGVRVGYYHLYGKNTPWEPAGSPGLWHSPRKLAQENITAETPLIVDILEAGTKSTGGWFSGAHGPSGWVLEPTLVPEQTESEGGNVATIDGSSHWKTQDEMAGHYADPSGRFIGYW